MANKKPFPDAVPEKQRPLDEEKQQVYQEIPHGRQPHEIAERANTKRQKKQMHKQDGK